MFRIIKKEDGFTYKYNENYIEPEEVYSTLETYLPKYFSLVEKTKLRLNIK